MPRRLRLSGALLLALIPFPAVAVEGIVAEVRGREVTITFDKQNRIYRLDQVKVYKLAMDLQSPVAIRTGKYDLSTASIEKKPTLQPGEIVDVQTQRDGIYIFRTGRKKEAKADEVAVNPPRAAPNPPAIPPVEAFKGLIVLNTPRKQRDWDLLDTATEEGLRRLALAIKDGRQCEPDDFILLHGGRHFFDQGRLDGWLKTLADDSKEAEEFVTVMGIPERDRPMMKVRFVVAHPAWIRLGGGREPWFPAQSVRLAKKIAQVGLRNLSDDEKAVVRSLRWVFFADEGD